ncbi:MAG: hypothetical protein QOD45_406 [Pseudonocardiales bacterium]|jgi:hypothetical protein|nr:hypothetical protein [Pseudonocardiales bacterium]
MSGGQPRRRAHRPALRADLTALIDAAGGESSASPDERAALTAAAVLRAGRGGGGADMELVSLAEVVGIDTLAQLWRQADPVSLPGALWTLYLLRQWCHVQSEQVWRYWRAGVPFAAADAVVAGVPDAPSEDDVARAADAIVGGMFDGDPAVALERAAALFRVLATGRRELAETAADPAGEIERALRNDRVAADLTVAAGKWRDGALR